MTGDGGLLHRLAKRVLVPLDVRHHTKVLSVEEDEKSVTVTYKDHNGERQDTFAACIIAVPGPLAAGI
ncbi:FAD-dependent oxidoreductase [Streptomyces sp. NPDC052092]|uniref:FAD-dependent oxidoreductase n=1 Tax=Streptomyces sp. NPDC052092 TaxID=3365685 RepID=UPI0037D5C471